VDVVGVVLGAIKGVASARVAGVGAALRGGVAGSTGLIAGMVGSTTIGAEGDDSAAADGRATGADWGGAATGVGATAMDLTGAVCVGVGDESTP
jgi:hypothetical protein